MSLKDFNFNVHHTQNYARVGVIETHRGNINTPAFMPVGTQATVKGVFLDDIKNNPIILYMKGTKNMPMCGFSATVVNILNAYNIDYKDVNVLEDPEIRVKLSEYSNWPTIPQLFVNGELIGGCDITVELFQNGELKKILGVKD